MFLGEVIVDPFHLKNFIILDSTYNNFFSKKCQDLGFELVFDYIVIKKEKRRKTRSHTKQGRTSMKNIASL